MSGTTGTIDMLATSSASGGSRGSTATRLAPVVGIELALGAGSGLSRLNESSLFSSSFLLISSSTILMGGPAASESSSFFAFVGGIGALALALRLSLVIFSSAPLVSNDIRQWLRKVNGSEMFAEFGIVAKLEPTLFDRTCLQIRILYRPVEVCAACDASTCRVAPLKMLPSGYFRTVGLQAYQTLVCDSDDRVDASVAMCAMSSGDSTSLMCNQLAFIVEYTTAHMTRLV